MATFNFDATAVQPQQSFSVLPAGKYIAQVVDSDVKTNKSNTGQYLSLQFEILDGEFKGRRVFSNITVNHQNITAQEIGQSQLSSLCRAVGVMQLTETSQLHGRPLKIDVKIRQDAQYGDQNDVKGFEAASVTATPSAQPSANTPPWQR